MISDEHILDTGDGVSLRDSVYNILKQSIMNGELKPDERLMEIPLANKLGVSRTPVREAIQRLEKEQLVIISPRCGARVAGITDKDVTDALDVRIVIESMAVRVAAQKITSEQLQCVRDLNQEMREAVDRGDVAGTSIADNKLHRAICEAANNNVLSMVMSLLEENVLRYRVEYIRSINDFKSLLTEHEALIQALENRDEEESVRIVTEHIRAQKETIRKIIQKKNE